MSQAVFGMTTDEWMRQAQRYYDCAEAIGQLEDATRPWGEQRAKAVECESSCRICGIKASVVHHLWSKKWPRENGGMGHSLMGLAVLCRSCHAGVELAPHVWALPLLAARPVGSATATTGMASFGVAPFDDAQGGQGRREDPLDPARDRQGVLKL